MGDWERYQDIFGQLRLLKSYSHLLLCFRITEGLSKEPIIEALESAVTKLITTFPWLAGKVLHEGREPGNSGIFRVAPCASWGPPNTILRVNDCSEICPPYAKIIEAGGPIKMFDPEVLAPCVAFPQSYQESESDPAFVSALQANFIDGGLLLDIATQHNIMDGVATYQMLILLAKALRGEEFSEVDIEQGNRDRRNMVRLLDPDEPTSDLSNFRRPSLLEATGLPSVPAPHGEWCFFRFPAQKLAELKSAANNPEALNSDIPFVSTNDALSAFIWKRLGTIRLRRLQEPTAISKFTRAADARPALGVPQEYMGNMVTNSFSRLSLRDLERMPLGAIASFMRKNMKRDVTEHTVRSFVTLIHGEPDKTTIMYGGVQNPVTDIAFSSTAQMNIYGVDFGILRRMDLLRRPNFIPKATTIYLWPKTLYGDIDGLLCLTEEELMELKADEEWSVFSQLLG